GVQTCALPIFADAVVADVAVLGEELREVEVVERGVEDRRVVLVPIRNVDIERARLERLRERDLPDVEVALEREAGVDARDRNRVARMTIGQRRRRLVEQV